MVSSSMTLSDPQPGFQGHCILTSRISQKRCILGTTLLKNTNRKLYTIYRIVPLLITLSDLWPQFQGHDIFRHWISEKKRAIATMSFLFHKRELRKPKEQTVRSVKIQQWNQIYHSVASLRSQLVGESPNVIGICAAAAPRIMLRIWTHSLNPIPKP